MKKIFYILFFIFILPGLCNSQTALILNGGAYVTLNGGNSSTPVYFIINTSSTGGITRLTANNGWVVSEKEFNYVQWNISNSGVGTYTVPFNYSGNDIPFSMQINSAGSAGGSVLFSTYHTASDNTLVPTYDGTNTIPDLNNFQTGLNNSLEMVDRWWIVDASTYGTKPAATMTFTYVSSEWKNPPTTNTITESNLQAQPFNSSSSPKIWDPTMLYGSDVGAGGPTGNVSGAAVPSTNLFRAWVLVDKKQPLPIELVSFTATCREDEVVLNWETASETNNDFFTIEKSADATNWQVLTTMAGAGNSNTPLYYSALDNQLYSGVTYYRLKQTDFDGSFTYSQTVSASCNDNTPFSVQVLNMDASHELQLIFNAEEGEQYVYSLYDIQGRLLIKKSTTTVSGKNEIHIYLNDISEGIYMIALQNSKKYFGQKILLK